ncbi:MAG: hypothetical protein GX592_13530 [Clostridiales bacterium]|nr:hypothetical protein [Clostridiales bacterium]
MRRKYVKYYEPDGRDADGKRVYRYTGPQFQFAKSGKALKAFKKAQISLSALLISLFVIAGFVGNDGTRMFYIALPYAALLLPAALALAGAWSLGKLPVRFSLPEERHAVGRLRAAAIACAMLSAMAAVGEIAFMLDGGASARECAFGGAMLLSMLVALFLLRLVARNPAAAVNGDAPLSQTGAPPEIRRIP